MWFWKFTCPAKIFACPANICTSPVKLIYMAGKISTCPDRKITCPVGHVTTKVYVPWDKIYMPRACRHALMSSPVKWEPLIQALQNSVGHASELIKFWRNFLKNIFCWMCFSSVFPLSNIPLVIPLVGWEDSHETKKNCITWMLGHVTLTLGLNPDLHLGFSKSNINP